MPYVSPNLISLGLVGSLIYSAFETGELSYIRVGFMLLASFFVGLGWCSASLLWNDDKSVERVISTVIGAATTAVMSFCAHNPHMRDFISSLALTGTTLFGRLTSTAPQTECASLVHGGTVLSIPFKHKDEKYILLVPHDSKAARLGKRAMSVNATGKKTDLHHHPGLSVLVKPEHLACTAITLNEEEY